MLYRAEKGERKILRVSVKGIIQTNRCPAENMKLRSRERTGVAIRTNRSPA